jgi:S-formylglutathione hydrolase FrmB
MVSRSTPNSSRTRNQVPQTIEGAFAKGSQEAIVVLSDSKTIYNGSMYSSSATTGDFEKFIYHDVVVYIDAHYRTIPNRKSRGLVGHSMGGYGAMDVGDQDGLRFDATKLHNLLDNYGVANSFEIYSGTHTSAVADRFQNHVLPFFSKNLCFRPDCR